MGEAMIPLPMDPFSSWGADVIGSAVGGMFEAVGDLFSSAVAELVKATTTTWLMVPTTLEISDSSGAAVGAAAWVQAYMGPLTAMAAVGGMIVGGVRIAMDHEFESVKALIRMVVTLALVSTGCAFVVSLLMSLGDSFSAWVLKSAQFTPDNLMVGLSVAGLGAGGVGLLPILLFFAMIAQVIQMLLLIARNGLVVLLVGVLPFEAAMSTTEWGLQSFKRATSWLLAFVLLKPASALIYACAFMLVDKDVGGNGLIQGLSGVSLLILAVVALPGLLRLISPVSEQLGRATGTAVTMSMVGVAATGAVMAATAGMGGAAAGAGAAGGGAGAGAAGAGEAGAGGGGFGFGAGPNGGDGGGMRVIPTPDTDSGSPGGPDPVQPTTGSDVGVGEDLAGGGGGPSTIPTTSPEVSEPPISTTAASTPTSETGSGGDGGVNTQAVAQGVQFASTLAQAPKHAADDVIGEERS